MTSLCTLNFVAHVINSSDSVVLRMYPWRSWRTVNEPSYTNQQSPTIYTENAYELLASS